jgi:hypothetical protein
VKINGRAAVTHLPRCLGAPLLFRCATPPQPSGPMPTCFYASPAIWFVWYPVCFRSVPDCIILLTAVVLCGFASLSGPVRSSGVRDAPFWTRVSPCVSVWFVLFNGPLHIVLVAVWAVLWFFLVVGESLFGLGLCWGDIYAILRYDLKRVGWSS